MKISDIISSILLSETYIVMSWGMSEASELENGLEFVVNGFKFTGTVRVVWTGNGDIYNVIYLKDGKVVNVNNNISNDKLVETIDNYVEKTENYAEDTNSWIKETFGCLPKEIILI